MHEITLQIDWAELDLYGHVNNVAYYKYMQSARIAFSEKMGLTVLNETGKMSFILAASECHYKQKLLYPGTVSIQSEVTEVNNTSFHLQHLLYNQSGEQVAKGRDVLVLYDYSIDKKVEVPAALREKLIKNS